MQTRFRFGGTCLLITAAILAHPLCAEDSPPAAQATLIDPDSADVRPVRSAGEYAIDRLAMTMITDSAAAVSRGTEVAALPTFHLKDVPMKNGTVAGLPRILAVKLTSLKLRNPANAPDAGEQQALEYVRASIEGGVPPRVLLQKIERPGAPVEWRVYKPLANIRQCGNCHGNPEEMSPELREALQKKYPEDKGTGFTTGQWSGLIRVTVGEPPSPPKPAAPAKAPAKPAKRA